MGTSEIAIRLERPDDTEPIRSITWEAFNGKEYSNGNEAAIVDGLRAAEALYISLVATIKGKVVGHVAFSPVTIDVQHLGWYGLGPVSVKPAFQRKGVGKLLITEGLQKLWLGGARGCVVLGKAAYYQQFGFKHTALLLYTGAPAEHFMVASAGGPVPSGRVSFHKSFN